MQEFLSQLNQETEALLVLSIILFAGFIMTRLTNTLNLPKVSGYILAGILIGPCSLNFIPQHMIDSMGFVSDLALAFIAFGVGKFFKKEVLMRTGKKIIVITISEALTAGVLVTVILKFIFRLDWDFALILGAIATATAPASTMMTINQYKAKGEFVNTLLQIVALDDVVCLLAFSIVAAIANGRASGALTVNDILIPIMLNLFAICLGFFCGYFLSRLLIPARSRDNRLILAIAMLLGLSGICAAADISPLLSCMVFGAAYINLTRDKKLFRQINNFTPPVMSIFFIVSGLECERPGDSRSHRSRLFPDPYCGEISGHLFQLSGYGHQQGNQEVYGACPDPSGRRRNRSGVSGTEAPAAGDGKSDAHHYSVLLGSL